MSDIATKIEQMFKIAAEIGEIDQGIGQIFIDNLSVGLNTLNQVVENGGTMEVDVSEQIRVVSEILGFSLEDMILGIMSSMEAQQDINNKDPDQNTLDFITQQADVDDYENFLAENKVTDNLKILMKQL